MKHCQKCFDLDSKRDSAHNQSMALTSQRDAVPAIKRSLFVSADLREADLQLAEPALAQATAAQQYKSYKSLVDRAIEVFGDDLTASRWLSMPSDDLDGKVPLQVAQSLDYDAERVRAVFEPIFIRIEHGIEG